MARQLKNSRLNPENPVREDAAGRAAARKHAIDKAIEATTGNAGLEQGDKAKKSLLGDNARDLKRF